MATTTDELIQPDQTPALPQGKLTFDEYLTWAMAQEFESEWVDGEVVIMSPASVPHEELFGFLLFLLKAYTQKHRLGKVLGSRVMMKLEAQRRGREPDILFIARARLRRLKKNYFDGPADMAVEIISPDSVQRDRIEKLAEYEAAGVKEYWLIDPERRQVKFYLLGDDGKYHTAALEDGRIFRSQVITGFWLRVEWLWQLPDELTILRELGIN